MQPRKKASPERRAQLIAEMRRDKKKKDESYRSRALNLFSHICGRCSREFSGKRLSELEVHHKDHDHKNNPPDGSNWELLCLYCHDHEHEKGLDGRSANPGSETSELPPSVFGQFEGLDGLISAPEKKKSEEDS